MTEHEADIRYLNVDDFYPDAYGERHLRPADKWLAQRCVTTPDGGWLIRKNLGQDGEGGWIECHSLHSAHLAAVQNWMGHPKQHCTEKDIQEFMQKHAPVVRGGMIVPTSTARGIVYGDNVYVNMWSDTVLAADPQAASDPAVQPKLCALLRMIREAICGKEDELSLDGMLAAANGSDAGEVEFRFIMSWLAAVVRYPGRNLQTNLVLLGRLNGVGKGFLLSVLMPRILGRQYCTTLNAEELENGWTDTLHNKLLVIVNELESSRKMPGTTWSQWIKRHTTEPVIQIRKRHSHSFDALNFANFAFSTNQENPDWLDATDRRNMLIATTASEDKLALSLDLYHFTRTHPGETERLLGAFVHLLRTIEIDWQMLDKAPMTRIKADAQESNTREMAGLYWLRNDDSYPRDLMLSCSDYAGFYSQFMRTREPLDPRAMGRMLAPLARQKDRDTRQPLIAQDKRYRSRAATYLIPAAHFPTDEDLKRQKTYAEPRRSNVLRLAQAKREAS